MFEKFEVSSKDKRPGMRSSRLSATQHKQIKMNKKKERERTREKSFSQLVNNKNNFSKKIHQIKL